MAMKMPKTSEMMTSLESGVGAMLRFLNKFGPNEMEKFTVNFLKLVFA